MTLVVSEAISEGNGEEYYRFRDCATGSDRVNVYCITFRVLKRTPCGVWVDEGYGEKRFILDGTRKRFAHPTEGEAAAAFLARKRRQVAILTAQLAHARRALTEGERLVVKHPVAVNGVA